MTTTVEEYLRAQIDYPFKEVVLKYAVISPVFAKPNRLRAVSLSDLIEDNYDDEDFIKSLKYATSTLYYCMAGVFSGGSRSEQVGDIRASMSGFTITQRDREYYRAMGDALRGEVGAAVAESETDSGGLFDASDRQVKPFHPRRRPWN